MGLQLLNLLHLFPHAAPEIARITKILQTIVFLHLNRGMLIHMVHYSRGEIYVDKIEHDNLFSYS